LPDLWKWTLASGLLAVILGILVLVWPGISILVAATLFGVYLLVSTLRRAFQHLHDTVADKQTKLDLHAALRGADLAEGYAVSAVDSPWPPSMRPNTPCWMRSGLGRRRRSPQLTGPGRA